MRFVVCKEDQGEALSSFLRKKYKESVSAKKIKKAIDAKKCSVNGKSALFASTALREGDIVVIDDAFLKDDSKEKAPLSVLFEDEDFLIVDKPPGLVCEEAVFKEVGLLVHRLDKDTSGLLLLAKHEKAQKAAEALFAKRKIAKLYLALVDGVFKEKQGLIDNFLGKKASYHGQTIYGSVDPKEGQRAITDWRVLAFSKTATLVLCDLKTGRTHQIRVHMSEKGHPILADHQYAKRPFVCDYQPSRQLLHAYKLRFVHPFTGKMIECKSIPPFDFIQAVQKLNINYSF
jgi:RluA family pseudouridine synthase